jgi:HSP20 family protein
MALLHRESFQDTKPDQEQLNSLVEHQAEHQIVKHPVPLSNAKKITGDKISSVLGITVQETEADVIFSIETSGINPKDLDIKVSEEAVFVKGKRRFEFNNEYRGTRCTEFHYCQFQQVIPLPALVHNGEIQATCKNGKLCLVMPKFENAKHRVVSVNLPKALN